MDHHTLFDRSFVVVVVVVAGYASKLDRVHSKLIIESTQRLVGHLGLSIAEGTQGLVGSVGLSRNHNCCVAPTFKAYSHT